MGLTKREVLIEICENPGWEPPDQGNGTERHVDELQREGWVIARLDGFTATAKALEGYPRFVEQADIAEPAIAEPSPDAEPQERVCVPQDNVIAFVVGVLDQLPVVQVISLAALAPTRPRETRVGPEWEIATNIVERLR